MYWVVRVIQTQSHFSNLFQQTGLSPLARYIEKVSVDCGFWGPCCGIYKSSLFSCRSKHIHAIINQSRIGKGLRLVPLAQLSHTGSRQWWSDCRLMWSQNSVAPQYCKMNPALSLLKTAREMKAVDRLPIPCSSTLMTDAPVRWHSPTMGSGPRWAIAFVSEGEMVGPGVCAYLFICLVVMTVGRYGPVQRACLQLKPLNLLVPGSTSSCGKKHWEKKKNQYEWWIAKNEKQMLKSTQGYEDASFSQGSCF